MALKKQHLKLQLPNKKGGWNINLRRYKNGEKAHGDKCGGIKVALIYRGWGRENRGDVGSVQSNKHLCL